MRDATKMSILVLLPILGLIMAPSVDALTTFGKTNPQNQNQNPPPQPTPVGKSRTCKLESDCGAIQNTTCIADPRDGKTRCLCGDYSAPVNGACTNKFKAIRSPCNEDSECSEGAHCVQGNNTMSGKRCYCQDGYVEENLACSVIF
ncbi:uncharacterized protein LOC105682986 isoform X2 [Athalia rosae]|uniref:uncharacterized protein LOC105682986 isoform X2 n=1 Tax=Athalia rosae TaxID=37344 RepID=UPI0020347EB9|nr:uncharacterized protein LOC105682986 isoform X2 [Athalia rosae]